MSTVSWINIPVKGSIMVTGYTSSPNEPSDGKNLKFEVWLSGGGMAAQMEPHLTWMRAGIPTNGVQDPFDKSVNLALMMLPNHPTVGTKLYSMNLLLRIYQCRSTGVYFEGGMSTEASVNFSISLTKTGVLTVSINPIGTVSTTV